jgi:hypothetical protein
VPEDTPTVAIIGNLDLDGNVVPGSAVRVPRSGFSIPAFPPDEIGSNVLGANDWNYRFVSFEYENDGETYITDPCLLADSEPEPPPNPNGTFTPTENITLTITIAGSANTTDCITGEVSELAIGAGTYQSELMAGGTYIFSNFGSVNRAKPCVGWGVYSLPPVSITRQSTGQALFSQGTFNTFVWIDNSFLASRTATYTATANGQPVNLDDYRD